MSTPEFEYTRDYHTDLQTAFELAGEEATGIAAYLEAIEDSADMKFKALLRKIMEQERLHMQMLLDFANEKLASNPKAV